MMDGFSIGGRNINNIRHADDTVLVVDSVKKLQALVGAVNVDSEEEGLGINKEKTECMEHGFIGKVSTVQGKTSFLVYMDVFLV